MVFSMENLKFHIILPYYKRQNIVVNALESIINSEYENWFLTFIDDSGNRGFEEVLYSYQLDQKKIEYVPICMSDEEKTNNGGSIFGSFINEAIKRIESDIIITLCDDDALTKNYMKDLNEFYKNNPQTMWSYCHVLFYNPELVSYTDATPEDISGKLNFLNKETTAIYPKNKVDSSQVSFRRNIFLDYDIGFPSPQTVALDAYVFRETHSKIGDCPFNNIIGQCKASFQNQLGRRISTNTGQYIKN